MKTAFVCIVLFASIACCGVATACEDPAVSHPHAQLDDPADIAAIRDLVLRRCGLSGKLAENRLPWYFHYEFGMALIGEGESQHAIEPLQMSANLRATPGRGVRMYGMWFINYLPYFQISLAYSELGDWPNAWNAILMSEELSEFTPQDAGYEEFVELKNRIAGQLDAAG